MAPCSSYRSRDNSNDTFDQWKDFRVIDLNVNLRNTKEISYKAYDVAEKNLFKYASGLSKPPQNFPNGPSPIYALSLDEAIFQARSKKTKKGILIVSDNEDINLKTKEQLKFHHEYKLDFFWCRKPD